MSVIEQAAKRLQELQRVGIEAAQDTATSTERVGTDKHDATNTSLPPRRDVDDVRCVADAGSVQPQRNTLADPLQRPSRPSAYQPASSSRQVELDLPSLAAAGILTPGAPRSQLADEFRVVKRPLIENASRKGPGAIRNGNLIIVTSSLPGEGKSFTAANLAMSIAMEMDRTVLLVDADVARPSLPRMLGLPPVKGLLDLLLDDSLDMSDVLLKSNVETLSILTSGTPHTRATELLASDAMNRLLEQMADRYHDRLIIFDSPPLLVTTEARVLASHMGQVVMVVQAGGTSQSDVVHALATIESCPVKMMMLNKSRVAMSGGYGYGYGYGYGS